MKPNTFIVYCSPAGTTRHVAGVIERELNRFQAELHTLDLGRERDWSPFQNLIKSAEKACLFIGSPVYRGFAVPPIMAFIKALAQVQGAYTVPFVTWGAVTSGIALWQMGKALESKGFSIAGAIKAYTTLTFGFCHFIKGFLFTG